MPTYRSVSLPDNTKMYTADTYKKWPCLILSLNTGIIQSVGAFLTYFTVLAEQGFLPYTVLGLRVPWENANNQDQQDSYGQEWVSSNVRLYTLYFTAACMPLFHK